MNTNTNTNTNINTNLRELLACCRHPGDVRVNAGSVPGSTTSLNRAKPGQTTPNRAKPGARGNR